MGVKVSKYPDAQCSAPGCGTACCDSRGHRVRQPHKSRVCSVCGRWYCGEHKNEYLRKRRKTQGMGETYEVYKCYSCVGRSRGSSNRRS